VKPTDVLRDLGVLLDRELTKKCHVSKTVSTCFYHLLRLQQLRRHVDIDTMKQLVSAFIFSRLDYYNAVLYTGYLNQPSALCNECRTPLLGSHLVCHHMTMSVQH